MRFLLPSLVFINVVTIVPFLYSLGVSFTGWTLTLPGSLKLVGLHNYFDVFTTSAFWQSAWISIVFTVASVSFELVLGTLGALGLNRSFFGKNIFRSLILIPMLLTPAAIGMFWRLLYSEQNGVLNFFLVSLGLQRVNWLNIKMALVSVIIMDVWQWTPFVFLLTLAGLQDIDVAIIEAAKVDGASGTVLFRYVELPHLMPYVVVAAFFRLTDAFREFDKIYSLTQGGPGSATTVLSILTYDTGFKLFKVGETAAISWTFGFLLIVVLFPVLYLMYKQIRKIQVQ
jgi:multiple sugar transport system permease protein/sorbitol/mannitol transport system permease protein